MSMLLLAPILIPIVFGVLWYALKLEGKRMNIAYLATMAVSAGLAVVVAFAGKGEQIILKWTETLCLCLRVDDMSRIYLLLISLIWPGVGLYATEYLAHDARPQRFFLFYTVTQGVLYALSMSGNLVTFYMFYEAMTLLTVPLVLHNRDKEAVAASIKYLIYSVIGASAALAGIFFVGSLGSTGDFAAGPLTAEQLAGKEGLAMAIFMTMIIGFSVKAGMFPLHGWLPTAHPVAPAPASAVLSGVITKMGVLGVVRVIYSVAGVERLRGTWLQMVLLSLSLLTVLMGSLLAFKEKRLKKRLAYSSVSQVSYVLFGLFTMTELGFIGAMLHVVFHSLMKNTLFMGAGAVIHKTEKTRVEDMDGLGKRMPYTYVFFTVASLGLIGIPPTGGFVSKWNLAEGALNMGLDIAWVGPVALLISAVLTAAYLLTLVIRGCFPGEEVQCGPRCEVSWRMLAPMALYAALIVGLGVFSGGMSNYFAQIAAALMG
ncbi:MAG: proton-conducting membrane transporter [Clostridiales bacterium]|nr:proton-conducting membrane transporter [Clostridiales bacterium]